MPVARLTFRAAAALGFLLAPILFFGLGSLLNAVL